MDDGYEALRETNYAAEEIILKIAEEQEAESKKNLEEAEAAEAALAAESSTEASTEVADTDATDEEDEKDKPAFDIYLRESARIMADWIQIEAANQPAVLSDAGKL